MQYSLRGIIYMVLVGMVLFEGMQYGGLLEVEIYIFWFSN